MIDFFQVAFAHWSDGAFVRGKESGDCAPTSTFHIRRDQRFFVQDELGLEESGSMHMSQWSGDIDIQKILVTCFPGDLLLLSETFHTNTTDGGWTGVELVFLQCYDNKIDCSNCTRSDVTGGEATHGKFDLVKQDVHKHMWHIWEVKISTQKSNKILGPPT